MAKAPIDMVDMESAFIASADSSAERERRERFLRDPQGQSDSDALRAEYNQFMAEQEESAIIVEPQVEPAQVTPVIDGMAIMRREMDRLSSKIDDMEGWAINVDSVPWVRDIKQEVGDLGARVWENTEYWQNAKGEGDAVVQYDLAGPTIYSAYRGPFAGYISGDGTSINYDQGARFTMSGVTETFLAATETVVPVGANEDVYIWIKITYDTELEELGYELGHTNDRATINEWIETEGDIQTAYRVLGVCSMKDDGKIGRYRQKQFGHIVIGGGVAEVENRWYRFGYTDTTEPANYTTDVALGQEPDGAFALQPGAFWHSVLSVEGGTIINHKFQRCWEL